MLDYRLKKRIILIIIPPASQFSQKVGSLQIHNSGHFGAAWEILQINCNSVFHNQNILIKEKNFERKGITIVALFFAFTH